MTELEKLRALCWLAYCEFNAVRARDGVPRDWRGDRVGITEEWWSVLTDALAEAAGTSKPWPDEYMRPLVEELGMRAVRDEERKS